LAGEVHRKQDLVVKIACGAFPELRSGIDDAILALPSPFAEHALLRVPAKRDLRLDQSREGQALWLASIKDGLL